MNFRSFFIKDLIKVGCVIFILSGTDRNDEVRDRDQLRMERHKERARERNLARAAPDKRYVYFKENR